MDEYKKYLAQQLLTEDKLVTYRLLSRALKVHVNTAKEYVAPPFLQSFSIELTG